MDDYGSFRAPIPLVHMQDLDGDGDGEVESESQEQTPLVSHLQQQCESHESEVENELVVKIEAPGDTSEPTLEPVGSKLKRNAQKQYNPHDWKNTLFVVNGRMYMSKPIYIVCTVGTLLVVLSGIGGIGLEDDRECRAWCSRFALGMEPHRQMGFILFLLMAFRTQQAYRLYTTGLASHFRLKTAVRRFVDTLLFKVDRDAIALEKRARMVAFIVSYPYAVVADLRQEREFDKCTVEKVLEADDYRDLISARSMPLFILDSLSTMVHEYCEESCSTAVVRGLTAALDAMFQPYCDCDMITQSPCAWSYIVHLRLLLIMYLVTLPLALVESMGFSTIPVFWVITYALMSLEMLAVEVENPFGFGSSDLRLHDLNLQIREMIMESWKRWCDNENVKAESESRIEKYSNFGSLIPSNQVENSFYW